MWKMALFIALFFSLTACQADGAETQSTEIAEDVPIATGEIINEFIVWGQSGLTATIDDEVKRIFEERHPEMEVIFVDSGWDEALRQNFENAIQMGRPPDVVIGENYFRYFASTGDIQPVDDILAEHDDIITATYAASEYQGQFYAVPYLTGIFALERNCAVIESAGLDCDQPPMSWDELLGEAQVITSEGEGDFYGYTLQGPGGTAVGSAFRIAVYQAQLDALPCANDACTIPDFNRAETLPVYEFLRELVQYAPPGLIENTNETDVYEALFRGVSAFQIAGSWHPQWATSTGCDTCQYSSLPIPDGGTSSNLLVGNVLYAAPTNSRHPELGLEWLSILISDDIQASIFPSSGRLPVRRSILNDLQPTVDDATSIFIDQLLDSENLQLLPQWESNPRAVWAIYNTLLEGVLMTDRPIEDLMAEAQDNVITLNQ